MGHLERIFTSLPWWKAEKESREQNIPRERISCNFLGQGIRHVGNKLPFYNDKIDSKLSVLQTKLFSKWVANILPQCDAYIGISGSGLHAGRVAKSRGAAYIMDRGSSHIRYANAILQEEYLRWKILRFPINPWLIENEESEIEEANLITVPSHFVEKTFLDQGVNPLKMRVVPYGISLEEFYPVDNPPTDCFRLVFVGQFSLRKGVPYLLEAFRAFKHPNKQLIVVGSVDEKISSLIKALVDNTVHFIGIVTRAEVKKYLSTAHALVLPSIEEGLALVQAQAMACGCPIIATPNTGSETLFKHEREGLIVEAQNSKALTAAFTRLADEPNLRNRMSIACLERAKEIGGWKVYAEEIVKVCREANKVSLMELI
ncbi:glycosyltransferase family 4 protein [Adhaeribacter radiodurans]|uniref:Glycosyltransferase family 4 protein n=1 Tax=Adhaeribacter radiodurans TaxID=2745197 RepID=A0A7L7L3P8_9BACT|nr:glycosyltransferase family 4 protein [Adhaeribacter radiodurans]QMU27426.1 glycosyltransferase family 4 protein [Adhaeribacter radiodurans]